MSKPEKELLNAVFDKNYGKISPEKMTREEIQYEIESQSLGNAVFNCYLCTDYSIVDGFNDLYYALPDWITEAIDRSDLNYDGNWDPEYWGSDSVVQFTIFPYSYKDTSIQELRDRLEDWKEEHEEEYAAFCNGMSTATWEYMQKQENFLLFDTIMRGK